MIINENETKILLKDFTIYVNKLVELKDSLQWQLSNYQDEFWTDYDRLKLEDTIQKIQNEVKK